MEKTEMMTQNPKCSKSTNSHIKTKLSTHSIFLIKQLGQKYTQSRSNLKEKVSGVREKSDLGFGNQKENEKLF